MFSEELTKTTAGFYKSGSFTGSGVVFTWNSAVYCITAAHNLYSTTLDQPCTAANLDILTHTGTHKVRLIHGEESVSKFHDIAILTLADSAKSTDFIQPFFTSVAQSKTSPLIMRGYYGNSKGPVNRGDVFFDEKKSATDYHFICDINKEKLANHLYQYGDEWLSGSSGSGLFYDDKENIACAGILLSIPDKGDNGKLVFCSVASIVALGVNLPITNATVFEKDTSMLTTEWFKLKMDESIRALGDRYTPKLNFQLPIAKVFDGLSRNQSFKNRINRRFDEVYKKRRSSYHAFQQPVIAAAAGAIDTKLGVLKKQYLDLKISPVATIAFQTLIDLGTEIIRDIDECLAQLYREMEIEEAARPRLRHQSRPFSSEAYEIRELRDALGDFIKSMQSNACRLANHPALILKGEGGYGKSHLLADIVTKRFEEGKLSLLLLGQHFVTTETVWRQALSNQIRLEGDELGLLAALNARAELSGHRIIIFVDAINEGRGKDIWRAALRSFMQSILNYQWLGVVVSIRTSYHPLLVDTGIYTDSVALSLTHPGFSDLEYEAADYFFDNYKIKKPGIPFLHPEFRSPLYLKLFCDGLKAKGMDTVPTGYNGITAIFDFFLDGINTKLSNEFGYNASVKLVKRLVYALARRMTDTRHLFLEEALHFAEDLPALSIIQNRPQFLEALIHEGVLSKNIFYKEDGSSEEAVYFVYERSFDQLFAAELMQKLGKNPMKAFAPGGALYSYFRDERACDENAGLVEAMSVQIPEKYDLEFIDVVPHVAQSRTVAEAFIQSLIWRRTDCFIEKDPAVSLWLRLGVWWKHWTTGYPKGSKIERLVQYLNQTVLERNEMWDEFRHNILLITADPAHYFNANFVHRYYMRQTMAERDSDLLPWISMDYHSEDGSPIKRLIDWAWKDESKSNITDESILLSATMMGWFLSSADRVIRDTTTKALVALLQHRPHLLVKLLQRFEGVNDPYIYERLLGVAYGCTLRSEHLNFLPELSGYLLDHLFTGDEVYPHLLARDYARGVVDFASHNSISLPAEMATAYPPYRSIPIGECPTNEELDRRFEIDQQVSEYAYYQNTILESMVTEYGRGTAGYGDFGRYTFESSLHDWEVNANELSNYAVQRVFEMGYDVHLHGWFDRYGRGDHGKSSERIGKKYQWIAMMEVLAKVADHAVMHSESDRATPELYRGPWQPNVRDIDPSIILKDTCRTDSDTWQRDQPWWINNTLIDFEMTNEEWMAKVDDIPQAQGQISVTDADGQEWLSLELMFDMDEEAKLGEDNYNVPRKRIYQQIRSYLVKEAEFQQFKQWGVSANLYGRHMPESPTKHGIFAREYYWSEVYNYFQQPYQGGNGDEQVYEQRGGAYVAGVHIPVEKFSWEKEFDNSKERPMFFYRPSWRLWEGLDLTFAHREGEYVDGSGALLSLDPSVNARGPACLLVRKEAVLDFLKAQGYRLCWTVLGEKQILGAHGTGTPDEPRIEHRFSGFYWLEGGKLEGDLRSKMHRY